MDNLQIAMTPEVKLTAGEQSILMDRLELSENIVEALTDAPEGQEPAVPECPSVVLGRVEILARLVGGARCTIPPVATDLDKAILVECVEGSTWLASREPEERGPKRRVMRSLIQKMITAGIAEVIDIPER